MATSRRVAFCSLLAVLSVSPHVAWSQTATVSQDRDVIAIIGVSGHDFHKFCQVDTVDNVEEMQWLHEDDVVHTIAAAALENERGQLLITNSAISPEDAGHYFCRINYTNNELSDRISAGSLTVLNSSVIIAPSPQYAVLNTAITLQCTVDGVDVSDSWASDGTSFTPNGNMFAMATLEDEGVYKCRLADSQGRMPTVLVDVQLKITVLPEITMTPAPVHNFTGDSFSNVISLGFKAREGDEFTSVSWWRDEELLPTNGPGYTIDTTYPQTLEGTTRLLFMGEYLSRSFKGSYRVVITNSNNIIPEMRQSVSFTFQIIVTIRPAPITDVNISSLSPQSIRVDWGVDYRHSDEQPDYIIIFVESRPSGAVTEYRIEDHELRTYSGVTVFPGTQYSVTLRSVNVDGECTTQPVLFQTQDAAASVEQSRVARINETAFNITTELRYTGGGAITHFNVSFRVIGESEWNGATAIPAQVVPESDSLVWTGVITSPGFAVYSALEFRVLVVNERGFTTSDDGPYVTEPQVTPVQPVSIEAISTTPTSAILDVQLSTIGTPPLVVVLDLTSHPELSCCDNMTTYTRGGTVRFSLEGLSQDTTYTVNVFAVNLAGQGNGRQESFSTDSDAPVLPLWQTVLIGVCGFLALVLVTVLFCVLLCCGCKASKKWGRKEYHTGPIEMGTKELDHANPLVTRSPRPNGYASSQISYGSSHGRPLTPRTPTGLSVPSPAFHFTEKSNFTDIHSRRLSSSMSPFHSSSRDQLTHKMSVSHGNIYLPPQYSDHFPDEQYQSLPRSGFTTEAVDSVFSFNSTLPPFSTISPPPAPKSFATDV